MTADNSEVVDSSDTGELLEKVLVDSSLKSATATIADVFFGIPIITVLLNAIEFHSSIHKDIFKKKMSKFLYQLGEIPSEKIVEKINEINNSEELQYSVGLFILEQLEKADLNYKPEILGKIFKAYLNEKLTLDDYFRLTFIINKAFFQDLIELIHKNDGKIYLGSGNNFLVGGELITIDLVQIYNNAKLDSLPDNPIGNTVVKPELTILGKKLIDVLKD